jgi:hypothetical protein
MTLLQGICALLLAANLCHGADLAGYWEGTIQTTRVNEGYILSRGIEPGNDENSRLRNEIVRSRNEMEFSNLTRDKVRDVNPFVMLISKEDPKSLMTGPASTPYIGSMVPTAAWAQAQGTWSGDGFDLNSAYNGRGYRIAGRLAPDGAIAGEWSQSEAGTEVLAGVFRVARKGGGGGGESATRSPVAGATPAGLGGVGEVPGPANLPEAIIGILAPGLLAVLTGLKNVIDGGSTPVAVAQTPPAPPSVYGPDHDQAIRDLNDARTKYEETKKQWEDLEKTLDKNDPRYATTKKQYEDYIKYQQQLAQQADARAQAIAQQAQQAQSTPPEVSGTTPDGKNYTLTYDPKLGGYINDLTGGFIPPDRLDDWRSAQQQNYQQLQDFRNRNQQLDKSGQDSMHQSLQAIKDKYDKQTKNLANLGKMEKDIILGNGNVKGLYKPPGEPGNILTNIRNLAQQILSGNGTAPQKYQSIRKLYGDTRSGTATTPDSIPSQNEHVRDIISGTVKNTVDEVVTGSSWKGMIVRGLLGVATGGTSEVVLVPVQSLTTMKDYVDKGGNSIAGGFGHALVEVAIAEITNVAVGGLVKVGTVGGKWAGSGLTKVAGSLKDAVKNAAKNGNSIAKTLVSVAEGASTKMSGAYGKAVKYWAGETAPPYRPPANLPKANPKYGTSSVAGVAPGAGPKVPVVSTGTGPNIRYVRQPQTPVGPHMTGMPESSIRHAQMVADKYGVIADVRPTTPKAAQLLVSGEAKPKPCWIKNKTISELDVQLGANADNLAKAGHFNPKMPPKGSMSDAEYKALADRFKERQSEYVRNNSALRHDPRVTIKDGIIIEKASGKPFTGDHDVFDIRGVDGKPVPPAIRDQVIKELSQPPFNAQHGAHMEGGWVKPNDSTLVSIDNKIIDSHTLGQPGSKPLISLGSDRPPESTFVVGGR